MIPVAYPTPRSGKVANERASGHSNSAVLEVTDSAAPTKRGNIGDEPVLNLDVFSPIRDDYRHLVEYQQADFEDDQN